MNKFLWGASTSGFQVEGGYNLGGKGLSTTDVRHVKEGIADTKVASDHYHHFKEDILLMKELGLKAYRFSFCWARIMPDGHHVNQEGLEFYDQIIQLCLENDIEPIPTLYHFEMPISVSPYSKGSPITTNTTLEKDGKTYIIDENGVATEKKD